MRSETFVPRPHLHLHSRLHRHPDQCSYTRSRSNGSAYMVVIIFAAILGIFLVMLGRVRSGVMTLFSKSQKDLMSNAIGEAGLNIALAEINLDPSFRTHWHYRAGSKDPWQKPVKKRASALGTVSGTELEVHGISNGAYSGETGQGAFKFRIAPIFGAKENKKTEALKESGMYVRAEVVTHIGDGKKNDEESFRKITALVERRCPAYENLLFDGEILDTAMGPYVDAVNSLSSGRLYGYQWITFTSALNNDQGSEIMKAEKIETAGMIRALKDTRVEFSDKSSARLSTANDSAAPAKFSSYDGYVLDGSHGAHPIKLESLPKQSLYEKAKRRKNSGGFIIEKGTFPAGKYKNPYDAKSEYVDLDFGQPHLREDATHDPADDNGGDTEDPDNGTGNTEEENDNDSSEPPPDSDDGGLGSPLAKLKGRRILIYSKVPLRIWGCPDRTTTIFCEQDVVIAGDFNQNPAMPQDYPNATFQDYKTPVKNGKKNHKVGALVMSMGRVLIDISRPTLFLKNEMRPYFLYLLGMTLGPSDTAIKDLPNQVCKLDPNPDNIGNLVGCGQPGSDGTSVSNYFTIFSIRRLEQSGIATGPAFEPKISSFTDFLTPSDDGNPHFGIRDDAARARIGLMLVHACMRDGVITNTELNAIFDESWTTAMKEEEEDPDAKLGAMGLVNGLFERARLAAGSGSSGGARKEGIYPPEITINAGLVSSTRRASNWKIGSASPKTFDEIGNVSVGAPKKMAEYIRRPRFIIQRVYGSEIRLASAEPTYFISGSFTSGTVLRRRIWDKSLTYGKYQPVDLPYFHGILTFRDDAITKKEFDDF
ncbi:MAG: hypothetical protein WA705_19110 [Candidatus Ozemobacteraceae bacterium]